MERHHYRRERENPSFSSTLLDSIYRSIDKGEEEEELVFYRETMRKKHSNCTAKNNFVFKDEEDLANFQRACLIEKWMEKKVIGEKVVFRRKSLADFERKPINDGDPVLLNSSSSSSDSSSGGAFSSSEAESVHGVSSRPSCYNMNRPKPIRTSVASFQPEKFNRPPKETKSSSENYHHRHHDKPKHEGGNFVKTKSRALKIYGDLKKVKQPISPGGRLASFLNSLFTAGNAKKPKISSSSSCAIPGSRCVVSTNSTGGGYNDLAGSERKIKSANASACSSASSFSRSCLSKNSSSHGKLSDGMKRSVRFYPVSVIVGEDCQPCGQKSLYQEDEVVVKGNTNFINEELKFHVMGKDRRVEEAARDLVKNYQKKVEREFDRRNSNFNSVEFGNIEDEDEDDGASYASSDLFELDNLSAIGIDRYREELPVYETTHLDTNRAIANGLIL